MNPELSSWRSLHELVGSVLSSVEIVREAPQGAPKE